MLLLDGLAPYRRANLLWDFAHLGVEGVERMMRERGGHALRLGPPPPPSREVAVAAVTAYGAPERQTIELRPATSSAGADNPPPAAPAWHLVRDEPDLGAALVELYVG